MMQRSPQNQSDERLVQELCHPLSPARVVFNYGMTGLALTLTGVALLPLLAILWELLRQGLPMFKWEMLVSLPAAPGQTEVANGFGNAILGTLMMVGLASLISVPLGILTAVFLSEFGKDAAIAHSIRFITTVLSGVPSIVVGLFAYGVVVLAPCGSKPCGFSGYAGAVALAVIMLPIVVLATEEALKLVPDHQRLASAALGGSSVQTTFRVVIRSALPGITTGVLLAIARAAGETAPLLFTALFSPLWPDGLGQPTPSLPVLIFRYYNDPSPERSQLLWTASLVLVGLVLWISIVSRYLTRSRLKVQ